MKTGNYMLLMLAPNGDWATTAHGTTMKEAEDRSSNMGSEWLFYPYHFIVKNTRVGGIMKLNRKGRVLDAPDELKHWVNKSIGTLLKETEKLYHALPKGTPVLFK